MIYIILIALILLCNLACNVFLKVCPLTLREEETEALPLKTKAQAKAADATPTAPAPQKTAPHQTVTPEDKKKMMEMLAKGMKTSAIAQKVHLLPRQVRRYNKDFNAKKTD